MTTTPNEPVEEPEVVPSGDPTVAPDEQPSVPERPEDPDAQPGQVPPSTDPVVGS